MRHFLLSLLFIILFQTSSFSQETEANAFLDAFLNNFERSTTVEMKIELLHDAAGVDQAGMGSVYVKALEFVLESPDIFTSEPRATELATLAVRLIGAINYIQAAEKLWVLFTAVPDNGAKVEILNTLGNISANEDIAMELSHWLNLVNISVNEGIQPDLQVVSEAVITLGKMGYQDSFSVLFTCSIMGYSKEISKKAQIAMQQIEGDLKANLIRVILESPVSEKIAALELAAESENLSSGDLGEIAQKTLEYSVPIIVLENKDKQEILKLRRLAVNILNELSWSESTKTVIEHFDRSLSEYGRSEIDKSVILEAIACLGSMGTHEAAVRLTLYIEVLNLDNESGLYVDEQLILAVISNLGRLGDKVALDSLLYVKYLNYSNKVVKAAREAQKNLKIR